MALVIKAQEFGITDPALEERMRTLREEYSGNSLRDVFGTLPEDAVHAMPVCSNELPTFVPQSSIANVHVGSRALALTNGLQEPILTKLFEMCCKVNVFRSSGDQDASQLDLALSTKEPGSLDECLYRGLIIYFLNVYNIARLCFTDTRMAQTLAIALLRFTPSTIFERECLVWILTVAGGGCLDNHWHGEGIFISYMLEEFPETREPHHWRSVLHKFFWHEPLAPEWEASWAAAMERFNAQRFFEADKGPAYNSNTIAFDKQAQQQVGAVTERSILYQVFDVPQRNPCDCSTYNTARR